MSGQKSGSLGVYKETHEKSVVNQRTLSDHSDYVETEEEHWLILDALYGEGCDYEPPAVI